MTFTSAASRTILVRGRTYRRWIRRSLVSVVSVIAIAIVTGMVYQVVAEANDRRAVPPPGQLIDVGGYRLHVHVMGEQHDGPTVLLDAAWGSAAAQWGWAQPEVAQFARVVSFDRPGQGYSDPPPSARDARQFAADLSTALRKARVAGPYVLVGHSMGSLTSRTFATQYPNEIAGLVLVDPRDHDIVTFVEQVFPDQAPVDPDPTLTERIGLPSAARMGILRLADMLGPYVDQLPPSYAQSARATIASTKQADNMLSDAMLGESAAALLASTEQLTTTPLIVFSASEEDAAFPDHARSRFNALHQHMAEKLSTRGQQEIIEGADHYSIVTDQQYARQVSNAIRAVVGEVSR